MEQVLGSRRSQLFALVRMPLIWPWERAIDPWGQGSDLSSVLHGLSLPDVLVTRRVCWRWLSCSGVHEGAETAWKEEEMRCSVISFILDSFGAVGMLGVWRAQQRSNTSVNQLRNDAGGAGAIK